MRSALQRIIATTDFHSAFDNATPLLAHLSTTRPDTLIVDCGDFFEGTGYYRLGQGTLERSVLLALYDVIAPGNHGWPHYFEPDLHRIAVCANAYEAAGRRLFNPIAVHQVRGRTVAVTGVIGLQAFNAIPYAQRAGQYVTDPVQALRELKLAHDEVDSWVVLSHSGFEEDLRLADTCPFLDIVFAGHCHSDEYGPVRVGTTSVLKGYELGRGFAQAEPSECGWTAQVRPFRITSPLLPNRLEAVRAQASTISRELSQVLGAVMPPHRQSVLDRRALLDAVAVSLHSEIGDAVLLNETALRTVRLGDTLTRGDLLAIEPFGNQLVRIAVPENFRNDSASLLAQLTICVGPLVTAPSQLPSRLRGLVTTDYLAEILHAPAEPIGITLAQTVRNILTEGVDLDPHRP